jgi:hypothetical protein
MKFTIIPVVKVTAEEAKLMELTVSKKLEELLKQVETMTKEVERAKEIQKKITPPESVKPVEQTNSIIPIEQTNSVILIEQTNSIKPTEPVEQKKTDEKKNSIEQEKLN